LDIELINTDARKPFKNLPDSYDLFGDGSIVLVDLPGHSLGLMRALVSGGPEADSSIDKVYELMNSEPKLEIVGSHDYRLPGRYNLAPKYYT
jgi:hypothetical protein